MDLYVYYRVREEDTTALRSAVTAMQAGLSARFAMAPQLKRRPEAKDGLQTWMEVYPAAPDCFEAELDAAAAQAGLAPLIAGPRKLEVFRDL